MLKKTYRLRFNEDFLKAYNQGRKVVRPHFILYISRHDQGDFPRLGLVVPRKVGNAVVRNRLKRVLRENFRKSYLCSQVSEIPHELLGKDLVVVVRPSASRVVSQAVVQEFDGTLKFSLLSNRNSSK